MRTARSEACFGEAKGILAVVVFVLRRLLGLGRRDALILRFGPARRRGRRLRGDWHHAFAILAANFFAPHGLWNRHLLLTLWASYANSSSHGARLLGLSRCVKFSKKLDAD